MLREKAQRREHGEGQQAELQGAAPAGDGHPPPGEGPEGPREGRHRRPRGPDEGQAREKGQGEEGHEARDQGRERGEHRRAFYVGSPPAVSVTIAAVADNPDGLRAVLYDWDGTLVDSAAKSYRCYVKVFETYGIGYDREQYQQTYTPDWYRTYEAVGLPREQWPEADALWTRCYEDEPSELLPGARETLERFAAHGVAQGLVSSGEGQRVRKEIAGFALEDFFGAAVVCGGETERRKPDPQPLLVGLERLAVAPEKAAYLGDSPEDVTMAKAAGVFAVGIPGGFPNREALAGSGPDLLAPTLDAALEALLSR